MIETVIINPHKNDREKISSILSDAGEIRITGQGKDGYDALKLISSLKPDIAILDNQLEYIEGEEIPPLLKIRSPSTAVVILTSRITDYQLYRAALNAVSGFICKETDFDKLPSILECVSRGGCFISPSIASRVLRIISLMHRSNNTFQGRTAKKPQLNVLEMENAGFSVNKDPVMYLSKMELRILSKIGESLTSDEIAEQLHLAVGTVRNYISSIMRKTGMRNRLQLARYALCCGLVHLNPSCYIFDDKAD
jgi:DNA-binding NarL/FixJ family response regulator